MTTWMTPVGVALIVGGIATLIVFRHVLFAGGREKRGAQERGTAPGKRAAKRGGSARRIGGDSTRHSGSESARQGGGESARQGGGDSGRLSSGRRGAARRRGEVASGDVTGEAEGGAALAGAPGEARSIATSARTGVSGGPQAALPTGARTGAPGGPRGLELSAAPDPASSRARSAEAGAAGGVRSAAPGASADAVGGSRSGHRSGDNSGDQSANRSRDNSGDRTGRRWSAPAQESRSHDTMPTGTPAVVPPVPGPRDARRFWPTTPTADEAAKRPTGTPGRRTATDPAGRGATDPAGRAATDSAEPPARGTAADPADLEITRPIARRAAAERPDRNTPPEQTDRDATAEPVERAGGWKAEPAERAPHTAIDPAGHPGDWKPAEQNDQAEDWTETKRIEPPTDWPPAARRALEPTKPATRRALDPAEPATRRALDPAEPATRRALDPAEPTAHRAPDPVGNQSSPSSDDPKPESNPAQPSPHERGRFELRRLLAAVEAAREDPVTPRPTGPADVRFVDLNATTSIDADLSVHPGDDVDAELAPDPYEEPYGADDDDADDWLADEDVRMADLPAGMFPLGPEQADFEEPGLTDGDGVRRPWAARADRRYGDRVEGWVRPEYRDEPVTGDYWTPIPDAGYGWPVPVERIPAVPPYPPASGFDPLPEEDPEPTAIVPQWPPARPDDRIGRPRAWSREEPPATRRLARPSGDHDRQPRERDGWRNRSGDAKRRRWRGGEPGGDIQQPEGGYAGREESVEGPVWTVPDLPDAALPDLTWPGVPAQEGRAPEDTGAWPNVPAQEGRAPEDTGAWPAVPAQEERAPDDTEVLPRRRRRPGGMSRSRNVAGDPTQSLPVITGDHEGPPPSARNRPRPRPRPRPEATPPDQRSTVYVSKHAADPG